MKDRHHRAALAADELQPSPAEDQPRDEDHQLLHRGAETPALGPIARTVNNQDKNGSAKPYQVKQVFAAIEKIENG